MEFKKAVKAKQKLRLAIDGVSGSGKTYTALAVASGMGGSIAFIDSEHGSASLYADRFEFDTLELQEFQIENYIDALNTAAIANYPIVIIDSTSHAWDALLERVDRIASQKYGGNTFRAWSEGTPLQRKLIEAMLNYPGHVIVTCRSKTEYSVDKDDKGKTTIRKVGTAAVQRQGFEYEFTMAMSIDANHVAMVTKDRTSKFQDKFIEKPGKDFGKELIAWLNEGVELIPDAAPSAPTETPQTKEKMAGEQYDEILIEISNIMTSVFENEKPIFTEEEKEKVRTQIKSFPKKKSDEVLKFVRWLLDEQKKILAERNEHYFFTHVSKEKSINSSSEPEFDVPSDDVMHFEDDIPDLGSSSKKSSIKESAPINASGELDIF